MDGKWMEHQQIEGHTMAKKADVPRKPWSFRPGFSSLSDDRKYLLVLKNCYNALLNWDTHQTSRLRGDV